MAGKVFFARDTNTFASREGIRVREILSSADRPGISIANVTGQFLGEGLAEGGLSGGRSGVRDDEGDEPVLPGRTQTDRHNSLPDPVERHQRGLDLR